MSKDKLNLSEHVEALFEGVEASDEQKAKIETVLEAAVSAIVAEEKTKLDESFEAKLQESITEKTQEMNTVVGKYLDYVIQEWAEENKLAIESGIRLEMAESFFEGMKSLFVEHNVSVPEGKEDVLAAHEQEIAKLKESLNESKSQVIELSGELTERDRAKTISEASDGLTDTQKEKFGKMIEGVEFKDTESYKEKISIIRESYFKGGAKDEKSEQVKPQGLNENADPAAARAARILRPYS